jgi:predicted RNase H-like HicB family nuclease
MTYAVMMEKGDDGSWWVRVPALPGCFSWGETREEAAEYVREAIQDHVEALLETGQPVPDAHHARTATDEDAPGDVPVFVEV